MHALAGTSMQHTAAHLEVRPRLEVPHVLGGGTAHVPEVPAGKTWREREVL